MKKLDWYIIKNFLVTFFFSIFLFVIITVVIDASEHADNFVQSKLGFYQIFVQFYLGFIPHMTALLFPLFVFIAVIFFTSKMAGRSEIIAILASGISYNRWLKPYAIAGIFLAGILWLGNMKLIPKANERRTSFETKYIDANSSYERTISTIRINDDVQHLKIDSFTYGGFYNYDTSTKSSSTFFGYVIKNNEIVKNFRADRMFWDTAKGANRWMLENVTTRTLVGISEVFKKTSLEPLALQAKPNQLKREKFTKDKMSSTELEAYIKKEKASGSENINELLIEQGRRHATPVTVFLLTLIGAIIAGRKVRGGSGSHLAMGFIIAALFILADKFSTVFCTKGNLNATLATWIPNIIFTFVMLYLYKKAPK
jgi:lipopolysaccharide export system permease protein